jgi:hypothetical protein
MDQQILPPGAGPALPEVIRQYLDAHDQSDTDTALSAFAVDAIVHDDGQEHHGHHEIRTWLSSASARYTFTRTLTGVSALDANTWLVTNHLEGDFPGGVVDLQYRFTLSRDHIDALTISA